MYYDFLSHPPYELSKKSDSVTWDRIKSLYNETTQQGGAKTFLYENANAHIGKKIGYSFFRHDNAGEIIKKAHQNFIFLTKPGDIKEDGATPNTYKINAKTYYLKICTIFSYYY